MEMNACRGGCVNGPGMPKNDLSRYRREKNVKQYIKSRDRSFTYEKIKVPRNIDFDKVFMDKSFYRPEITEEDILTVLRSIDKYNEADELNCSACGYATCREKARAVLEGMAETSMCLPYMKGRAERLSNHIFENSPNACLLYTSPSPRD